ncbi:GH36 C-terminal domain-containing protein, partial [Parabacteroides goldsteinii]
RSKKVKLRGLEPDASYRIEGMDGLYAGRLLMNIGVEFPLYGAFKSRIFKIVKQ